MKGGGKNSGFVVATGTLADPFVGVGSETEEDAEEEEEANKAGLALFRGLGVGLTAVFFFIAKETGPSGFAGSLVCPALYACMAATACSAE